ncbi:MAG: PT domain-containing protein [Clostridia bacterium]|nr:PT domain-containing protein [Clostridia bacterium]
MKKRSLLLILLAVVLCFALAACNDDVPEEKSTGTTEVKSTDAPTEAPTEEPTEAPTEAPTEEPTEAPTEEPTEADPDDPTQTPIKVGTSYDGKTPSYDGRLNLFSRDEWFDATDSTGLTGEFDSIQDAMDFLEGVGGNIMVVTSGDIGLCLDVVVPDDYCFYRLAYNWNNCDFTFNYGYTYDDGTGGYAYYSMLEELDKIAGLDGTHVYCWSTHDEFPQGYYLMTWVGDYNGPNGRNYIYEKINDVEEVWPGLPYGETYFED